LVQDWGQIMAAIILALATYCHSTGYTIYRAKCKTAIIKCIKQKKSHGGQGTNDEFLWECIIEREKL